MNRLRTILTWGLLVAATHVMGYTITVDPIEIEAGKSTNLIINLTNTETNLTAYQMKLFLPDCVTVQKKSNGKYAYTINADRHDGAFSTSVKDAADGSVLITCYSADKDVITGTSGELIRLPLDVASTVTTSLQGSIKDIEFTDVQSQDHTISDVSFSLTVKKTDDVTLTAKSYSRQYGEDNPTFEYEVTSGIIASGVPTITCSADKTSPVGTYDIVIAKGSVSNSTVNLVKGTLTITKAPLTISAGDYSKVEGEENPTFTPQFSGFKNGETKNVLTKQPTVNCEATTSSAPGIYTVTVSGAEAMNYNISYRSGTLTVTTKPVVNDVITFADTTVEALCVQKWDTDGDGKLSKDEAAAVTDMGTAFKGNKTIKSFDELQYFTGLTSIGEESFMGCTGLIAITIPNSVRSIGWQAFYGCSNLTSITFPNSLTNIAKSAFSGCSSLTSVIIPSSVVDVASYAFYNCSSLQDIIFLCSTPPRFGIEVLGGSTTCSIYVPNKSLDAYKAAQYFDAYADRIQPLSAITGNIITNGDLEGTDVSCFYTKGESGSIVDTAVYATIAEGVGMNGSRGIMVNSIPATYNNGNYDYWTTQFFIRLPITLPADTKYRVSFDYKASKSALVNTEAHAEPASYLSYGPIGEVNFATIWQHFEKTETVSFEQSPENNMRTIAFDLAMQNEENAYIFDNIVFEILEYPEVQNIDWVDIIAASGDPRCFYVREYPANEVRLAENVDSVFTVTSKRAPNAYDTQFYIRFPQAIPNGSKYKVSFEYMATSDVTASTEWQAEPTQYNKWGGIGDVSFTTEWQTFNKIGIVDADKKVSHTLAFNLSTSKDVTYYFKNIKFEIPADQVTEFDYPKAELGSTFNASVPCGDGTVNLTFRVTNVSPLEVAINACPKDISGSLAIPATVKNDYLGQEFSVTSIGSSAFSGCNGLTSVTIPNSVTSIGNYAFASCSGLTSIKVESGNTVYDSRNNCNAIIKTETNELIAGCMNATIPNGVKSIGEGAFFGCSGLTAINIPNSVTSIGDGAFPGCSGLISVTIPNSVTSIGIYAFQNCSSLTSVTIPNSVTSIGSSAFHNCSSLTSVTIPNSVTGIEGWVFKGCSNLTSVTIPNSVTSIGSEAFSGCSGLTSVTVYAKTPMNYGYCFPNRANATLYVPEGCTEAYQAARYWNEFKEIKETYVKLSKYEVSIQKGKTVTLKYKVYPTTEDQSVTWESSDPTIAKVTSSGKIGGLKVGKATITCTSKATGLSATCEVTVGYVKLNYTELTIAKDKIVALKSKVYPTTEDQSVTWKSSDPTIVKVASNGKIKGLKAGKATITCTSKATGLSTTCEVTVGYVELNYTELTIEKGEIVALQSTVYPTTEDQSVTWKSSDPTIVKVTSSGKIKGLKVGKATITCTSNATGAKATCEVTVGYVKLNYTELTVEKGEIVTLKSKVYPTTEDQGVTWVSSSPTIVKVTSTGKIKGLKVGTATITCTSNATGLSATCEVTVVKAPAAAPSWNGSDEEVTGVEEKATLAEEFDVYDLNGRKVLSKVTSLEGLPDGVYIVNGKKVVVKK